MYEFANLQPNWTVGVFDHVHDASQFSAVRDWGADGIIACLDGASDAEIETIIGLKIPIVNVGTIVKSIPSVAVSPVSVLDLLKEHLQSTAPSTIVVVGNDGHQPLADLLQADAFSVGSQFCWSKASTRPRMLLNPLPTPEAATMPDLQQCLMTAAGPITVVATNDCIAIQVDALLRTLPVEITDELTLFSARDSPDCAMDETSISAVVEPDRLLAFEAAKTLRLLLNGSFVSDNAAFVDADEIRSRQLTASDCPEIPIALDFIRQNVTSGINVQDVMRFLKWRLSRVSFERHFRIAVGRAPSEEIRRLRLEHAKRLLLSSNDSIACVARNCGFDSLSGFSSFFRNGTAISPSEFRRQSRALSSN